MSENFLKNYAKSNRPEQYTGMSHSKYPMRKVNMNKMLRVPAEDKSVKNASNLTMLHQKGVCTCFICHSLG